MELYLVRHGPAEARDPVRWPSDDDRPLSAAGVGETRDAARGFAHLDPSVRRVVTSPAERARATAVLFQEAMEPRHPLETWEELAPDSPAEPVLRRAAHGGKKSDGALLVGHEPILSEVVGLALCGEAVSVVHFPRAGAARITFERDAAPGTGRLEWLLTRRQLAALGR